MGLRAWAAGLWERRSRQGPLGAGYVPPAPVLSGTYVTPQSALGLLAYYAAINVLSRDVASLPLNIYKRLPGGGREPDETHPYHDLFNVEVNDSVSSLKYTLDSMGHTLGWGNSYTEVVRDRTGQATELHLLHPSKTLVKMTESKRLYYEDEPTQTKYAAENVIHFAGLGFNGIQGYTPAFIGRQGIGLGVAAEQFGAAYFGNGIIPKGVLKTAKKLGPAAVDNLRRSIGQVHQGSQSAHQLLILEEGLEWAATMVNPDDSQFIATRAFQVIEIARLFGLPPHKIGDYSQAHHTNVEESNLDYLVTTLCFWLLVREREFNRKLLSREDRKSWVIAHDISQLLRGNTAARMAYYQGMRNMGCMSADDILKAEGRNPIGPKKGGDKYLVQAQYTPLDQAGKAPFAPPKTDPAKAKGAKSARHNPNHGEDGRFTSGSGGGGGHGLPDSLADHPDPVGEIAKLNSTKGIEAEDVWLDDAREAYSSLLDDQAKERQEHEREQASDRKDFEREQASDRKDFELGQKSEAKDFEREQASDRKDFEREQKQEASDFEREQKQDAKDAAEEEDHDPQEFAASQAEDKADFERAQSDAREDFTREQAQAVEEVAAQKKYDREVFEADLKDSLESFLEDQAEEAKGLLETQRDARLEHLAEMQDELIEVHGPEE